MGGQGGKRRIEGKVEGLSCLESLETEKIVSPVLEDAQNLDPFVPVEQMAGKNLVDRSLVEEAVMKQLAVSVKALDNDSDKEFRGTEKVEDHFPASGKLLCPGDRDREPRRTGRENEGAQVHKGASGGLGGGEKAFRSGHEKSEKEKGGKESFSVQFHS
jgi:hypothetical protein